MAFGGSSNQYTLYSTYTIIGAISARILAKPIWTLTVTPHSEFFPTTYSGWSHCAQTSNPTFIRTTKSVESESVSSTQRATSSSVGNLDRRVVHCTKFHSAGPQSQVPSLTYRIPETGVVADVGVSVSVSRASNTFAKGQAARDCHFRVLILRRSTAGQASCHHSRELCPPAL